MCSRYILVAKPETIEARFSVPLRSVALKPNYNISPGQFVPVITNRKPGEIQFLRFGLTPFWAKSEMNLFNARAEGDSNPGDNHTFRGAAGIIQKKAFRKSIRSQRCIVLASAFIEWSHATGISQPYLIYLRNHLNPFALAGIWDTWLNPKSGVTLDSFSIITITANGLLRSIGSKRMPVILSDSEAKRWINTETELSQITRMLNHYDSGLMNAYPVSPRINNQAENDKLLIQPTGERLLREEEKKVLRIPKTPGYHQIRKKSQLNEQTTTLEQRLEQSQARQYE